MADIEQSAPTTPRKPTEKLAPCSPLLWVPSPARARTTPPATPEPKKALSLDLREESEEPGIQAVPWESPAQTPAKIAVRARNVTHPEEHLANICSHWMFVGSQLATCRAFTDCFAYALVFFARNQRQETVRPEEAALFQAW